jgi:CHAT domain-containing protein/tetratricopeptide (TPR) repeat protein
VATSDEQFGETPPYHPDMTSLPAADLLRLALPDSAIDTTSPCLDELALARIAEGRARAAAGTAIAHLASCGSCRRQLAALMALLRVPVIASEVAPIRGAARRPGRPMLVFLGLAAAAAMLFLLISFPGSRDDPNAVRDPTLTAITAPAAIEPVGAVERARSLTWTRVDGASSYRVTLFDSTGTVLFELQLADTTVTLPDSVQLVPRRAYAWKVEARTGWDRWSASELFEFRIASAAAPKAMRTTTAPGVPAAAAAPVAAPDSLQPLTAGLSDAALMREVRARPGDVRDAFRAALAATIHGDSSSRAAQLVTARRLAAAYQAAWRDDFLAREVARFTAWSPARRAARVWTDSVRVAGNAAYGRDGPRAAIAVWQQALPRARTIPDSAGIAALLGNIGAALARESQVDSALTYLTRAQRLAESAGDLRAAANAVSELGGLSEQRDDIAAARAQYARAIELRGRIGDSRGLAADYNNIASLSRAVGDLDDARRQLEAALALNRRDGRATAAATNLVNLASLAAEAGAFGRADADYREALAAWRAGGDSAEAASALNGLGELNLRRGDYPAAFESFTAAVQILDRTGPVDEALAARQRLASTLAAQGLLQQAVDELRRGQQAGESLHVAPEVRGSNALARADLALQLNRHAEAEVLYASAARLFDRAGVPEGAAAAQHGLGMLYLAQGNPARAAAMLDAALQTQTAAHDGRSAAITRVALGSVAAQAGDTVRARRHLERASAELDRLGDPVAGAAALNQRAELESDAGRFAAAESLYRAALGRLGARVVPDVSWRIHAGLAGVRARLGGTEEAAKELRASIADIERVGASLRLPERRSGLLSDKWVPYQRLASLELDRGRVAASFAVSEALRAREMVALLSLGRVAAPRDTAADLIAREQDLRRRIGELARDVEVAAPDSRQSRGPEVARAGVVSREALLQSQAAYTALQLEIRERAPRHAALVSPDPITWQIVAQRLRPDEALLEYLISDTESFVYVITPDTLAGIRLGVTQHDLARRVEFARGALQPRGVALDAMWRAPLRQLHRDLIEPIEASGLLAGKTRLTIIPHAELHYLPFAALIEKDGPPRFLVQRYQLSLTPSASVWIALGKAPGRGTGSGMLALAPHPDRLPASRREIAMLARVGGGDVRVLTGAAATEAAFGREAPRRRLIHLATYGVLNKQNPLFSFIDLAPDGQADGRLEAHEVFGLTLVADLVVLSACQTALASGALTDVPAGDDWVGLSRAFLTAGAKNVMASLWAVQDRATATLMERFYERYGVGADPARTLAAAQRAMLALPATAHPYYWAGFEVIGGR